MPDLSHPCPTCGVNIQFPETQTGEAAQCPICGADVQLIPQSPAHEDFVKLELAVIELEPEPAQPLVVAPVIQPNAPTAPPVIAPMIEPPRAAIERKNEFIGSGCILQGVGLAMMAAALFVPIFLAGFALIFGAGGLALLLYGSRISSFLRCSLCKGKIEKGASVCPHCNAYLTI